jgi:hypothetical protein
MKFIPDPHHIMTHITTPQLAGPFQPPMLQKQQDVPLKEGG